jgi:hypothetical protein
MRHTEGVAFCIYGIFDPRDDLVFYIGHTSRFALRRAQHLEGADSLSGLRMQQIKANGFVPVFVKLEACRDKESALMAEIFWIEHFKGRGARLMNAQGFSGYVAREGERQRLEAVANGRPLRQGRSWTKRDDALLAKLDREGKSAAEIADALKRTIGGIEARLARDTNVNARPGSSAARIG